MPPWFTESVRNKVLLVAGAGLLTAVIAYSLERWLEDEPVRAGLKAGLEALVVILVGTVITAVLEHSANERAAALKQRAAALEQQRRQAARSQLLDLLGPNLKLAGTAWLHRPGLSAPHDEDVSLGAGVHELRSAAGELGEIELKLKELHENVPEPFDELYLWLQEVRKVTNEYWLEGGRPIRFRYLMGIRNALLAVLGDDAEDALRAQFTEFAGALDLAEGARLKVDAVVQERLVVATVGEPLGAPPTARETPDVAGLLQSVAATSPGDSVLHLMIVADALSRRAIEVRDDPPEHWRQAVVGSVNRCIGALEHEVANGKATLLRLVELVRALQGDGRRSASLSAGAVATRTFADS